MLINKKLGFAFFWPFCDTAIVCRHASKTSATSKLEFFVELVNVTLENEKLIIYYPEFHAYVS